MSGGELLVVLSILGPLVGFVVAVLLVIAVLRIWHHVAAIRRALDGQAGAEPKRGGW